MKYSKQTGMNFKNGDRLVISVISKFVEPTRQKEFNFGGVIELNNGKSMLSTVSARFKIEAMRHFEAVAKELDGTLNIKTVREI